MYIYIYIYDNDTTDDDYYELYYTLINTCNKYNSYLIYLYVM